MQFYSKDNSCLNSDIFDLEGVGLYSFGARYLSPTTSRWLSADPGFEKYLPNSSRQKRNQENILGFTNPDYPDVSLERFNSLPGLGGVFNPVNLHLYNYTGNNPVIYVDPDGKFFGASIIAGAVVGAAAGIISGIIRGEDAKGIAASAVGGAICGAVIGAAVDLTIITGGGALVAGGALLASGAIGGAGGSAVESAIKGEKSLLVI